MEQPQIIVITYIIYDCKDMVYLMKYKYKSSKRARSKASKLNLEYGAERYVVSDNPFWSNRY